MGLMLNHQAVKTTDACDLGAGAFNSNSYNFTATVNPFNLRFEFLTDVNPVVMKIDNGMYISRCKFSLSWIALLVTKQDTEEKQAQSTFVRSQSRHANS